jgi:hypothetical protein
MQSTMLIKYDVFKVNEGTLPRKNLTEGSSLLRCDVTSIDK